MPTLRQYADQAKELKAQAKGFEVPVFEHTDRLAEQRFQRNVAASELAKLGDDSSRIRATRKFALAAQAIRAKKQLNSQTMQMK